MAEGAYGAPIVLTGSDQAAALERMPLSSTPADGGYDEAFIQNLVFQNPSCLPVDQIDRSYEGLVPVCMELNTGAGPLDALYVTPKGHLVVLEAKLWRNPEARRKVVAQVLDYAKELASWDYDDLQREVSRRTGRKGNVLYDLVSAHHDHVDEARFVDEIQRSLRTGRFLLLVVGDGIREGAATIATFLEQYGRLDFTFGLVEIELYRLGSERLLVLPRVLARTVVINRHVIAVPPGFEIIDQGEEAEKATDELNDSNHFYLEFWKEFTSELQLDDPSQPIPKTTKITNLYFPQPPSGSVSWISLFFSRTRQCVGVYLTFVKGNFGDIAYARLLEEREDIEKELGIPVDWESKDGRHKIVTRQAFTDVWSREDRAAIKDYLAPTLNQFVNVFRTRLEKIANDLR